MQNLGEASSSPTGRTIMVLGAYGLIGRSITTLLIQAGHNVVGLGRNPTLAKRIHPDLEWVFHDLRHLHERPAWDPLLENIELVVNCAGALQENQNDNLDAVHFKAIKALASACAARSIGIVQISATGAQSNAKTSFMRSKAAGDEAIKNSGADYWIFRPGVALARTAYGGTALLRMLASIPYLQPIALPDAKIQTVSTDDIGYAVVQAIGGNVPAKSEFDLVENEAHTLKDIVLAHRKWLGFENPRGLFVMPDFLVTLTAKIADILGHLGWRSPLRTTAFATLENNVLGDPAPWSNLTGNRCNTLDETLEKFEASVEHRLHARLSVLMPVSIGILAIFWIASGFFGLFSLEKASLLLTNIHWPKSLASGSVIFWSIVDMMLAAGLLVRKTAKIACIGIIVVSFIYLMMASVFTPLLWSDPLGPLFKILPGIMLAATTYFMLDSR